MRLLALSALVSCVAGHGKLTVPKPRDPIWRKPSNGHTDVNARYRHMQPKFLLQGPVNAQKHQYSSAAYRCGDFKAQAPQATVHAGQSFTMQWEFEANHPGDCALYATRPEQALLSPWPLPSPA